MENKVPSKEDFSRAKVAAKEDDRGLNVVRQNLLLKFKDKGLHELMVVYSRRNDDFCAYVFFSLDRQILDARRTGLTSEIETAVIEELETAGRIVRQNDNVRFEIDSHENVERNYNVDYYMRLR